MRSGTARRRRVDLSAAVVAVVLTGVLSGCTAPSAGPRADIARSAPAAEAEDRLVGKSATLLVHGVACPHCAEGVDAQLRLTPGVRSVSMDVVQGVVRLELDPEKPPTSDEIKAAVRHGGAVLVELRQP